MNEFRPEAKGYPGVKSSSVVQNVLQVSSRASAKPEFLITSENGNSNNNSMQDVRDINVVEVQNFSISEYLFRAYFSLNFHAGNAGCEIKIASSTNQYAQVTLKASRNE